MRCNSQTAHRGVRCRHCAPVPTNCAETGESTPWRERGAYLRGAVPLQTGADPSEFVERLFRLRFT
jgi:hypothetical protein